MLKKEGVQWVRGLAPKIFLANLGDFLKKIGAKGVGCSGSATETKYFDTPRHQSKMAPALLCLIA